MLFVLIIAYGCGAYKVSKSSVLYSPEQVDKIMDTGFTSHRLSDIPAKLNAALSKDHIHLTADSVDAFTNYNTLFKLYGESKRKDSGYLVVKTNERTI